MASTELVVQSPRQAAVDERNGQRQASLERLATEAATADANRAHEIMMQGRAIARLLREAKEPFEDAWLAGKASVVAARRLARLITAVSNKPQYLTSCRGSIKSPRTELVEELGISVSTRRSLERLDRMPDPDFQRYIQATEQIPSLNGACMAFRSGPALSNDPKYRQRRTPKHWRAQIKARAGAKTPNSPSLDEAYSLIVKSLGHLAGCTNGGREKTSAVREAMDHLYAAEDLLKPYRAGYDGTGRKAA